MKICGEYISEHRAGLTTADRVPSATAQCSTNERSNVNDWPITTNPNRYSQTGNLTTANNHQLNTAAAAK